MATLQTYRIYRLDERNRIIWGDWIEAHDDDEARALALKACNDHTAGVQVWQGPRYVADETCHEDPAKV